MLPRTRPSIVALLVLLAGCEAFDFTPGHALPTVSAFPRAAHVVWTAHLAGDAGAADIAADGTRVVVVGTFRGNLAIADVVMTSPDEAGFVAWLDAATGRVEGARALTASSWSVARHVAFGRGGQVLVSGGYEGRIGGPGGPSDDLGGTFVAGFTDATLTWIVAPQGGGFIGGPDTGLAADPSGDAVFTYLTDGGRQWQGLDESGNETWHVTGTAGSPADVVVAPAAPDAWAAQRTIPGGGIDVERRSTTTGSPAWAHQLSLSGTDGSVLDLAVAAGDGFAFVLPVAGDASTLGDLGRDPGLAEGLGLGEGGTRLGALKFDGEGRSLWGTWLPATTAGAPDVDVDPSGTTYLTAFGGLVELDEANVVSLGTPGLVLGIDSDDGTVTYVERMGAEPRNLGIVHGRMPIAVAQPGRLALAVPTSDGIEVRMIEPPAP